MEKDRTAPSINDAEEIGCPYVKDGNFTPIIHPTQKSKWIKGLNIILQIEPTKGEQGNTSGFWILLKSTGKKKQKFTREFVSD